MKVLVSEAFNKQGPLKAGDMFIDYDGDMNIIVESGAGDSHLVAVCLGNSSGETAWVRKGAPVENPPTSWTILPPGTRVTLVAE